MFTHCHRARQIIFVDSAERSQKVAGTGPHAFGRVGMDLTNTIAIIIACPFMFAMIDGDMRAGNLIVAGPFIRIGKRGRLWERTMLGRGPG